MEGSLSSAILRPSHFRTAITAQYTDRALLEVIHGQVQIAPLGRLLTARRHFPRLAPVASTRERLYFPTTGHSLSGQFLAYWQSHHGATVLGAPISEVLVEGNGDGTHHRYTLQWFERGRSDGSRQWHAVWVAPAYDRAKGCANIDGIVAANAGRTVYASPLIASSSHPGLAYTVGAHVYRTTDGGSTWQEWDGGDLLSDDRMSNVAGYLP